MTALTNVRWRERAVCRAVDPETFFPTAESGPEYEAQVAVAKAVCAGCPVRAECLAEALARIPFGIAGGLTPEERRAHRTRQPAPAGAGRARQHARHYTREATGQALLAKGRPAREVAAHCGVTERTVARWAARARTTARAGEGSAGGHRAPLQTSRTHDAPTKDTNAERTRT